MCENGKKLKVYCETSFWSYLTARPSSDPEKALRQVYSLRWWETAAQKCDVFVSDAVLEESRDGDAVAAAARCEAFSNCPLVEYDREKAITLAVALHERQQVFEQQFADATHIAISAVSGMDILLTWNCKHLANMVELPKTAGIVVQCGYRCPAIITPKVFLEEFHDGRRV